MKPWLRAFVCAVMGGWLLSTAWAETAPRPDVAAPMQAIQQASDPSAAVAAYANGFAIDRNNPKFHEAYVARMVELGLPELAYRQAQLLTSLQSDNGLAWGVVAYVDARRGEMTEAVSAITLAGQFAPENQFVQHTAGEIVAWYDVKADKAKLPDATKDSVTNVRRLLSNRPSFTEALENAKKAYQAQASEPTTPAAQPQRPAEAAPAPVQPQGYQPAPSGYTTYAPADMPAIYYPAYGYDAYPAYYPDYYCGWGPGWVEPWPWWWWRPIGCFSGFGFFPTFSVVLFADHDDFRHFDHDGFSHHRDFDRDDFHHGWNDPAAWHHNTRTGTSSFGAPTRPSNSVAQWTQANFHNQLGGSGANRWFSGHQNTMPSITRPNVRSTMPDATADRFNRAALSDSPSTGRRIWPAEPSTSVRPAAGSRGESMATPSVARSWGGNAGSYRVAPAPRNYSPGQNFRGPAFAAPSFSGSFRSYGRLTYNAGGWNGYAARSSAPFRGYSGGGFHGGGFSGGRSVGGGSFHGTGGFGGGGGFQRHGGFSGGGFRGGR